MFPKSLFPGLLTATLLIGCGDKDGTWETPGGLTSTTDDTADPADPDSDGDGFVASEDCDDTDSSINPGQIEICDGTDNNCDGEIDEGVTSTWYGDADDDGFGDTHFFEEACDPPSGFVATGNDCDDSDGDVYPGAPELCTDETDRDCDGIVEYADDDGDGWAACEDCDDSDPAVNPDATEVCDQVDNDCDDDIDEDSDGEQRYYADADSDGFGDADESVDSCEQPTGYVSDDRDCDDTEATVNPDGFEICDGLDNDCNGTVDDDPTDTSTWYADADGDGFGDGATTTEACSQPTGYVRDSSDCDDTDAAVNPDAAEVCDGADNDCDGTTDVDAGDVLTWYTDDDGDGFGDASATTESCDAPSGAVADDTDCDDTDAAINPDADEVCDDIDNDCDGDTDDFDDSLTDATSWYRDLDADGYGYADYSAESCDQPSGYVADDTDCDDNDGSAFPGNTEVCDEVDNDCDGDIDEDDADDVSTWFADADSDGYGDPDAAADGCVAPTGYVEDDSDCDDTDASINPAAAEICDEQDNNCDGDTDEDAAIDATVWYDDADEDTFGDPGTAHTSCESPSGYTADNQDCDDTDAAVNPDAAEVCDGIDNDCNEEIDEESAEDVATWYADADGDGFGDGGTATALCDAPSGYVSDDTDCDDANSSINPDAAEVCDEIDNDCDGTTDEDDAEDAPTWYADTDGDGFGDADDTSVSCAATGYYVSDDTDCDDNDSSIYPSATELCNEVDDDCDGTVDEDDADDALLWYADTDGDTYGDVDSATSSCDEPSGYVPNAIDCDDDDADINPDADEVCDGADNNCDGETDEDTAEDSATWYADNDGDGFGDAGDTTQACEEPDAYSADDTDCDDANADINPDAEEVCDNIDNDCDEDVDEDSATDAATWYADSDSDGYGDADSPDVACDQPDSYVTDDTDCDDTANDVNPGETEVCNDIDDDCNGDIDDDDSGLDTATGTTWYADTDADDYGVDTDTIEACEEPEGYTAADGDCDDDDSAINPDAAEVCDEIDNDCDEEIDEDTADDATTWYGDNDGDGYGSSAFTLTQCEQPSSYVATDDDCDDLDADINPGAAEVCNQIDDDCNGDIDDDDASVDLSTGSTWYPDDDGDGFGSGSTHCQDLLDSGNTADGIYTIYPFDDGTSLDVYCNMTDDDGGWMLLLHHDAQGNTTFFSSDADAGLKNASDPEAELYSILDYTEYFENSDGTFEFMIEWPGDATYTGRNIWTQTSNPTTTSITGYTAVDVDYTTQYWGGLEPSGGSSYIDGSVGHSNWFYSIGSQTSWSGGIPGPDSGAVDVVSLWVRVTDASTDSGELACEAPSGTIDNAEDCDDTDAAVNPDATEVCDSIDNDCDGDIDDDDSNVDATDLATYYADADGDGYGDPGETIASCDQPSGYVSDDTDCDDTDGNINPSADEVCDGQDNDCDEDIDDDDSSVDTSTGTTWYSDSDSDGYGDSSSSTQTCDAPDSYVEDDTDCDDTNDDVNPGASEICNSTDDDCNGDIDDDDSGLDTSTGTTWYADDDGDSYGDADTSTQTCEAPSGYLADSDDCDDTDADINPDAAEVCDGEDNDCDGDIDDDDSGFDTSTGTTYYADTDGDGYGDSTSTIVACDTPSGYVTDATDCDDTSADVSPGGTEVCDGLDNDCSGTADDDDELLGSAEDCPAVDCLEIYEERSSATDDKYWIDPTESGAAFEIFCDLTNDGGGWTLVANVDDVTDPYFGGLQIDPWETDELRNETTIPTFDVDVSVSTKYESWSTITVSDVRIVYKNSGSVFLCEGLSWEDTLDTIFADTPTQGACSSTCSSWSEDLLSESSKDPAGLNCSDPNEGWITTPAAENARIGALSSSIGCCAFNGFLGTVGDRGYSTSYLEKTWGAFYAGTVTDDNIMMFVR